MMDLLYSWPSRMTGMIPGVESTGPGPAIYLTVDDGPDARTTGPLLEALAGRGVLATFFLVGSRVEREPRLACEVVAAGHAIGSHGYAHLDAWTIGRGEAVRDLEHGSDRVQDLLGVPVVRVRPPFGHLRPATVSWARRTGRILTMWSLMPGDFEARTTSHEVALRVSSRARPGEVVVLHDAVATAAETVAQVIDRVRDGRQEPEFGTLD